MKKNAKSMLSRVVFLGRSVRAWLFVGCCVVLIGSASGCMITDQLLATQRTVTIEPLSVMVERDLKTKWRSKLGVLAFTGPSYVGNAKAELSTIYFEKMLANGPFQQTLCLPVEPRSDVEAIQLGADHQCDVVLTGAIDYLLESSGATPTALEIHIRILEVRTGLTLAYYRQRARSHPGSDVDLCWKVLHGDSSLRMQGLAQQLAEQGALQLNSSSSKPSGN